MTMIEKLENLGWFSRLEDLVEALEDEGLEVLEVSSEHVVVGYEDDGEDVQLRIDLGGTARTIVVANIEEVYRG